MNGFYYKLFLSFILFIITGGAIAQQEYLFSYLGTREGLMSNDVTAVQQDKKGFIWIATFNGLQRYDGSRLLTFRHKAGDSTSIPGDQVLAMQLDSQYRLWLLCNDDRAGYFSTTDFRFHPVAIQAKQEAIGKAERRLFKDEDGNIYLRLYGEPLLKYNEATQAFSAADVPFSLPQNWHAIWLHQDKQQHNYWIACDSGLVKYNPRAKTLSYRNHNTDNDAVITQYASLTATSLPYLDSKGRFWIISWPPAGLTVHSFNIHSKKEEHWERMLSQQLHAVYYELDGIREFQDSTLWFNGYNIFATFNNQLNSFELVQNNLPGEYSIHYDMVYSLFEDREHNRWVCTNKGLYRFNPSAALFHTIGLKRAGKDSLYTPEVADIMQIQSGDILVSTWGSGIFAYDSNYVPKHLSYTEASFKMGNQFVWATHQRANGDIWCAHQNGILFILHPASNKVEKLQPPQFEGSTIRQIAEDKEGNLWFGTQRGALIKWVASNNTFIAEQQLHSTVFRLYVDWEGNVWVCTKTEGVYKIKVADGSIAAHYTANGPAERRLMTIAANDIIQYSDSIYMIACGGINVLNTKTNTIRYLHINNDAFSNLVTNMVKDKQGLLWVTTQSGLFSINPKNEVATYYNESDGLPSINYSEGTGSMLNNGRIVFGTVHNYIAFDPSQLLAADLRPPKVEITGFSVMNKGLRIDSLLKLNTITLPYDQNAVTIAFSTLSYQNAYAILYKMEGLDKDWISAKSNEAIYNYLPPGTYTFKIMAVNADNVKSKAITTLTVTVEAPFYKSWWFYSLLLLVFIALLYWLDRERMKRKAVLQAMRSNISGKLHEEISKSLENINVLSEIARIKADKEPEQSKNYIDEIHHKSNNLIEAMDDMLWSIDPVNDTMLQTISRMKEIAHAISHQYNTVIQVQNDDKVIKLKPDMSRRHELMMIYKISLQLLAEQMQAHSVLVEINFIKSHVQLNMFAANAKVHNMGQVQNVVSHLKNKAAALKSSLEMQADEKGVGIILTVKR